MMKELEDYKAMGCFSKQQLILIELGLKRGLNVSLYADPQYSDEQMHFIKDALGEGYDVSRMLTPSLTFDELRQIEFELEVEHLRAEGFDMNEEEIQKLKAEFMPAI